LLRDLCGEHRREINILVGALRERVPLDLLAGRNSVPPELLLRRLAKRLEEQLALTEEASRWAVDSWALALGIVSDAELHETERRRDEASARVEAAPPSAARRPAVEDEAQAGRPAANSGGRPPATPPRARQSPPPPATKPPTASNQASPLPPPPRATSPTAQGSPTIAARHYPAPPTSRAASLPQAANTGGRQTPLADAALRGWGGRWRGCLVGCFLLILLAVALFVGGPLVVNILREEQQQRNLEPAPAQTR
jgi:hypothetical protein